jgi:hypothetical protein
MSEKIKPQHVARKAMLYVRQSSSYQVTHNLESLSFVKTKSVPLSEAVGDRRGAWVWCGQIASNGQQVRADGIS